jgi:glycosyltransferase involved in cell wall biosynthesis
MHILSVMQCTELGGMEQSALRFMVGLQSRGHSCEVISVNPVGRLKPLLEKQGIAAVGVPFRGKLGWRSHLRLRRTILEGVKRSTALLMTGPTLSGIAALPRRRTMRRVLNVQFHHKGVKAPWAWRVLYRMVSARFDAVTFPSDFTRLEAEELFPPLRSITHTVRNPIPMWEMTEADRIRSRRELGLCETGPVIGNAGWLIPRKRFDVFLRSAAVIAKSVPDASFVIAGDGDDKPALMALAEELGIGRAVHWLGWQNDLVPFYRALDLLLFNTDWDAFPTTPLEAMAYGVPTVASSAYGGLHETICRPEVGFLTSEHDHNRLAAEAVKLLTDPRARKLVGEQARAHVRKLCDLETSVSKVERLLAG